MTTSGAGNTLDAAVIQFNAGSDKASNVATALDLIDRAASSGARLIALPEIWTYFGDQAGNFANAEVIPGPVSDLLAERARRHRVYLHSGSYHERIDGETKVRNTAVVFNPDGDLIAQYSKIHMFDVTIDGVASYEESATVAPGHDIVTFDLDGVTVGLTICYDLRFPELFRILALRGAELIVLPAAFTLMTGRDHWELLIRARAVENGVFMVAPNQWGPDPAGWCFGRSIIVDPWGTVLATAPDADCVIGARLDLEQVGRIRRQVPSLNNRVSEAYEWPDRVLAVR